MKAKAIVRIVICSVLFSMLLSILLVGLRLTNFFNGDPSGETTILERKVNANTFNSLEIDWAAGSVTICTNPSSTEITIKEVKDKNDYSTMSTEYDDSTLKISYDESKYTLSHQYGKNLVILVPPNWGCTELEINGAALNIDIHGVDVQTLELNGASNKMSFAGVLYDLSVGGAANSLDISITRILNRVKIDGMGCKLDLKLPSSVGFEASLEGLGVSFESSLECIHDGSSYTYGNKACKIDVSGLGCKVSVDPS